MELTSFADGDDFNVLEYDTSKYFPNPYAVMLGSMIEEEYDKGYVTYPEVKQSWELITAGDEGICLDPPGGAVLIYTPPEDCGNTPPQVCYPEGHRTVQDLYDDEYACTEENNEKWKCLNFYQDKCGLDWNPPECADWTPPGTDEEDHDSHDHAEGDHETDEEDHDSHDHAEGDHEADEDKAGDQETAEEDEPDKQEEEAEETAPALVEDMKEEEGIGEDSAGAAAGAA